MKESEVWEQIESWLISSQNREPGTFGLDPAIFLALLDLKKRIEKLEMKKIENERK